MNKIYRFMIAAALLMALWFVGHIAVTVIDGLTDNARVSDVGVVLGNKVERNGKPSARLKSRLDRGVQLYRNRIVRLLIVSGGLGREGFDEATVMADYLAGQGIPREDILVDSNGNNSYLTARYTACVMKKLGLKSVIAVTQYFHVTRTKLALRRFGIETVRGAHAHMWPELRDPYSIAREFVGYYAYLVRNYERESPCGVQ